MDVGVLVGGVIGVGVGVGGGLFGISRLKCFYLELRF